MAYINNFSTNKGRTTNNRCQKCGKKLPLPPRLKDLLILQMCSTCSNLHEQKSKTSDREFWTPGLIACVVLTTSIFILLVFDAEKPFYTKILPFTGSFLMGPLAGVLSYFFFKLAIFIVLEFFKGADNSFKELGLKHPESTLLAVIVTLFFVMIFVPI